MLVAVRTAVAPAEAASMHALLLELLSQRPSSFCVAAEVLLTLECLSLLPCEVGVAQHTPGAASTSFWMHGSVDLKKVSSSACVRPAMNASRPPKVSACALDTRQIARFKEGRSGILACKVA